MYQLCLLYMLIIAFTVCPTLMVNHPFLPTCLGVAFTSEIASKQSRAPPQAFSLIREEALGVLNRELYHNSVIIFILRLIQTRLTLYLGQGFMYPNLTYGLRI